MSQDAKTDMSGIIGAILTWMATIDIEVWIRVSAGLLGIILLVWSIRHKRLMVKEKELDIKLKQQELLKDIMKVRQEQHGEEERNQS